MAAHSSLLAWNIPWTEEPGGLQSMGSQRVGHDWAHTAPPSLGRNKAKSVILEYLHCTCLHACYVCLSPVWLLVPLWTVAYQAPPLFVGFSRQEYWSGLPCPPPGDLPEPGIKPASLKSPALAGSLFTTGAMGKPLHWLYLKVRYNKN